MILVVPKKTLTALEKKNLLKNGYVVIECEKPESVRVLSPEVMVDKSDLFLSALTAIVPNTPLNSAEKFVKELHSRLVPAKPVVKKQEQRVGTDSKAPVKIVIKEPIKEY